MQGAGAGAGWGMGMGKDVGLDNNRCNMTGRLSCPPVPNDSFLASRCTGGLAQDATSGPPAQHALHSGARSRQWLTKIALRRVSCSPTHNPPLPCHCTWLPALPVLCRGQLSMLSCERRLHANSRSCVPPQVTTKEAAMLCRVRRLPLAQLPYLPPDPRRSINSLAAAFIESLQVRRSPPTGLCSVEYALLLLVPLLLAPCCSFNFDALLPPS